MAGRIVGDQLEQARAQNRRKGYMRLAGSVCGTRDLSGRKGFTMKGIANTDRRRARWRTNG